MRMRLKALGLLVLLIIATPLAVRAAEPAFDVSVFGHGRAFFMIPGLSSGKDVWDESSRKAHQCL